MSYNSQVKQIFQQLCTRYSTRKTGYTNIHTLTKGYPLLKAVNIDRNDNPVEIDRRNLPSTKISYPLG